MYQYSTCMYVYVRIYCMYVCMYVCMYEFFYISICMNILSVELVFISAAKNEGVENLLDRLLAHVSEVIRIPT